MAVTETQIMEALRAVRLPQGGDIVSEGMVSGLALRDGHVSFAIEVNPAQAPVMEPVRKAAEKARAATENVIEEIKVASNQVVDRVRELIEEPCLVGHATIVPCQRPSPVGCSCATHGWAT